MSGASLAIQVQFHSPSRRAFSHRCTMSVSTWLRGFLRKSNRRERRTPPRPRRVPLLWELCEPRMLLASTLSINDVHVMGVNTGKTDAIFTVTLSPPNIEQTITVDFSTAEGTGVAGRDYQSTSGTLTFLPDDTTKTIDVPILSDSLFATDQFLETFSVNLSNANPTHFVSIAKAQGIATIDDTNVPGALQFSAPTYSVQ